MKAKKTATKYTSAELADSFVFRTKLSAEQQKQASHELAEARQKAKRALTTAQTLQARVLQLRYQIEDCIKSSYYNSELSFAYFLRKYIDLNYKTDKTFARDIHIDPTELSQILHRHRAPSEKTMIRLELHSNSAIPALSWYKLLEKEREYELENDLLMLREKEEKYVKNRLDI